MENGRPPALPSICSSSAMPLIFADQLVLSFPDQFVGSLQSPLVTLTVSTSTFPFGSPEQQFVAWLAAQPSRSAFVDDVIMETLVPFDSFNPQQLFLERALNGLVSRKLCERRTRTRWWVFSQTALHLTDTLAQELTANTAAFLQRMAQHRAQLGPEEKRSIRHAFDRTMMLRTQQSTSRPASGCP